MARRQQGDENSLRFYEQLGSGMYGTVYRAQGKDGRMCAVKEITLPSEERAYATMNALGALARLNGHKNIVRLFNTDQISNRAYVISELCERNLNQHVCSGLPVDGWRFFSDLAYGVQYLNKQNILHRHLKPDNVMVHSGGCKISDSGQVRALEQITGSPAALMPASPYGTMGADFYLAPELVVSAESRGGPGYMNKCDVFSLGCIYLVLFTRAAGRFEGGALLLLPHVARTPLSYCDQAVIEQELHRVFNMSQDARRLLSSMLQPEVRQRTSSDAIAMFFQQQDQLQWPVMAPGHRLDVWFQQ